MCTCPPPEGAGPGPGARATTSMPSTIGTRLRADNRPRRAARGGAARPGVSESSRMARWNGPTRTDVGTISVKRAIDSTRWARTAGGCLRPTRQVQLAILQIFRGLTHKHNRSASPSYSSFPSRRFRPRPMGRPLSWPVCACGKTTPSTAHCTARGLTHTRQTPCNLERDTTVQRSRA